jgi:hypothetical protein
MNNNISDSQNGIVIDKEAVVETRSYIFEVRLKRVPSCRERAVTRELACEGVRIKAKECLSTLSQHYDAIYWGNGVAILKYTVISVTF